MKRDRHKERDMGCYPLGKMVSKALKKCKGEKRYGGGTTMIYSPPPAYSYARSMARHVTFAADSSTVILPPESAHVVPPVPNHHHEAAAHAAAAVVPPSPQPEPPLPREQPSRVRFTPSPGQTDDAPTPAVRPPKPAKVKFAAPPEHHHHGGAFPHPNRGEAAAVAHFRPGGGSSEPSAAYAVGGPAYRYMTSPLPRWEEGGDRRREYFSGEYHSYPTPVRDGIYRIATDANRLTTLFSEENPNACSIV